MNDIIIDFFCHNTEKRINKELLYCKDNKCEAKNYVVALLNLPLEAYIKYIQQNLEKEAFRLKRYVNLVTLKMPQLVFARNLNQLIILA